MQSRSTALAAALVFGAALAPQAAGAATKTVVVQNPGMDFNFDNANGFELGPGDWATLDLPGATGTYRVANPVPGWIVAGTDAGVVRPASPGMFTAAHDNDVLYIGGTQADLGSFTQDFGPMKKNAAYTITLDIGWRNDVQCSGYVINVMFAGVVKKTFRSTDCHELTQGAFTTLRFPFTAPAAAKDLSIQLATVTPGGNLQIDYDNFRLTYVPAATR